MLRDLVLFVKFKKREKKNLWRKVTLSKVASLKAATLLKVTLLHGCFLRFLNCTTGTKSHNAIHIFFLTREHKAKFECYINHPCPASHMSVLQNFKSSSKAAV